MLRSEVWVEQHRLVEIPEQADFHPHGEVEAFDRVRAVPDGVAEVENGPDALPLDVRQDGGEGSQVGVDVAENGTHGRTPGAREPGYPSRFRHTSR
jgi:hypothetical protein